MKKIVALISAFVMVFGMGAFSIANAKDHPSNGHDKVGICHRTGSDSNPYVYISVPEDEANGHLTGTDKQHNEKVTWKSAGTWRGVAHNAGDVKLDYRASDKSSCEDTVVVVTEPPVPTETPTAKPTDKPKDKPTPHVTKTPRAKPSTEPAPVPTVTPKNNVPQAVPETGA